jgi:hypothetical protein
MEASPSHPSAGLTSTSRSNNSTFVTLSRHQVTFRTGKLLYLADMATDGIFDALQALRYSNAVEVIDEVLAFDPAATVADVRQYASIRERTAKIQLNEAEGRRERAVCQHCGIEIFRGNDGAWYHDRLSSWGSRGCRAYSYSRLGTWDNTLDRRWTATPT